MGPEVSENIESGIESARFASRQTARNESFSFVCTFPFFMCNFASFQLNLFQENDISPSELRRNSSLKSSSGLTTLNLRANRLKGHIILGNYSVR